MKVAKLAAMKKYEVSVGDGKTVTVYAHDFTVSGSGLIFEVDSRRIAWFLRWEYFREITGK